MIRHVLLASLFLSQWALAQGTEGPLGAAPAAATVDSDSPEAKEAKALLQKYLTAVKAKKWTDAKKWLHPQTLAAIAERKKRMGKEDHPMAPWFHEKVNYWLKDFKLGPASPVALGAYMAETQEDNYQVADKGVAEGEPAAYLLGKKDGKWFVVDKKRNEVFSASSVKLGYKGWFDKVAKPPDDEP